jgi:hypothetical protein
LRRRQLEKRVATLEKRIALLEAEVRGGIPADTERRPPEAMPPKVAEMEILPPAHVRKINLRPPD